ncbi:hypothetical protein [Streptomyces sp. JV190]|uniref:hypothetical protein n=1 Tax=Streptomyces sp. JV190 TaxID=3002533 RepID=UPI002E790E6A|nr:hypothetical protein [Streptomyces sp. JV190]MEE1838802.1 hypothetical protein [Streptomyces sp. JV190]
MQFLTAGDAPELRPGRRGVLHELVLALRDLADITVFAVFAVGDTDQSVYGFTGADAKYLTELADRADFRDLELEVNYRSGQDIITAAEAALGLSRGRLAREGAPPGDVNLEQVEGGLADYARVTCDLVEQAQNKGISPERIAIRYPARGRLLDEVRSELTRRQLDFRHEGDDKLPVGSLSRFVQRCASRAVTNYQIHTASGADRADMLRRTQAPSLASLARAFTTLRTEAQLAPSSSRLFVPRALQLCLDPDELYPAEAPALAWLEQLRAGLALDEIAAGHPDQDNTSSLDRLAALCRSKDFLLQNLARGEEVIGKVLLATYHAAEGREFDTVILPGLLQGLIPRDVPSGKQWRKPTETGARGAEAHLLCRAHPCRVDRDHDRRPRVRDQERILDVLRALSLRDRDGAAALPRRTGLTRRPPPAPSDAPAFDYGDHHDTGGDAATPRRAGGGGDGDHQRGRHDTAARTGGRHRRRCSGDVGVLASVSGVVLSLMSGLGRCGPGPSRVFLWGVEQ